MTLQEYDHCNSFLKSRLLSLGYKFKIVSDCKKWGVGVFWKDEKFKLIEFKSVYFNDIMNEYKDEMIKSELNHHNVGMIVILESKKDKIDNRLLIASTHLYWNPLFNFVKFKQIEKLLKEINKMNVYKSLPVIITGDFNITPNNFLYKYLTKRIISEGDKKSFLNNIDSTDGDHKNELFNVQRMKEIDKIIDDQKSLKEYPLLRSIYSQYRDISSKKDAKKDHNDINEPLYTNYTLKFKETLDYIFEYSNEGTKSKIICTEILKIPSECDMIKEKALPNREYSSDHISLVGKFCFMNE